MGSSVRMGCGATTSSSEWEAACYGGKSGSTATPCPYSWAYIKCLHHPFIMPCVPTSILVQEGGGGEVAKLLYQLGDKAIVQCWHQRPYLYYELVWAQPASPVCSPEYVMMRKVCNNTWLYNRITTRVMYGSTAEPICRYTVRLLDIDYAVQKLSCNRAWQLNRHL